MCFADKWLGLVPTQLDYAVCCYL